MGDRVDDVDAAGHMRAADPRAPYRVMDSYGFLWQRTAHGLGVWTESALKSTRFKRAEDALRIARATRARAVDRNGIQI